MVKYVTSQPQCAKCLTAYCQTTLNTKLRKETLPKNCPIKTNDALIKQSIERYKESAVSRLYIPATITEKEAYQRVRGVVMAVRPRVKELIEFAKLLKLKKIGVAFCSGLRDEASRLTRFLEKQGFNIVSVVCKCGAIDKTELGVDKEYKIGSSEKFESACNPILQAILLNQANTEINVIVGLCLGHDILFTTEARARALELLHSLVFLSWVVL
jgi:uncharacterized metal-binding protein